LTLLLAGCEQPGAGPKSASSSSSSGLPAGYGIVVGGIEPDTVCMPSMNGVLVRGQFHGVYAAGTVTVMRGNFFNTSVWIPDPLTAYLQTVATQVVPKGGEYRVMLPSGPYVLERTERGTGTITGGPWVNVLVAAGQTTSIDLPSGCI
jgi:hypothetical protein